MEISLDDFTLQALEARRDSRAIFERTERSWARRSHSEIASAGRSIAAGLRAAGLRAGDRVVLALDGGALFASTLYGLWGAEVTVSPVAPPDSYVGAGDHRTHLRRVVAAVEAQAIITDRKRAPLLELPDGPRVLLVEDLVGHVSSARGGNLPELLLLQLSGGTTGPPKAVPIAGSALVANSQAIREWLPFDHKTSGATWLPVHHDMGLIGTLIASLVNGFDLWSMRPVDFVRNPLAWVSLFDRGGATCAAAPPFALTHLMRRLRRHHLKDLDLRGWRSLVIGAERVAAPVIEAALKHLMPYGFSATTLRPAYGLAESTLIVCGTDAGSEPAALQIISGPNVGESIEVVRAINLAREVPEVGSTYVVSCGRPVRGMEVDIVDVGGNKLSEGMVGEIQVRGSSLASGYVQASATTSFGQTGFRTGDIGFVVGGELYVLGRAGDAVKVNGRSVFAEDLEQLIAGSTTLLKTQFCVILADSAEERPTAYIVVERGLDRGDDIASVIRSEVGDALRSKVVAGGILRTTSGKVRRQDMLHRLQNLRPADSPGGPK